MSISKEKGLYYQEKWEEMEYRFANIEMKQKIEQLQQENKQLKENKKELIEFLKEYDKYRDSFKWNEQDYIDTIEKIKEILGDKENENNNI